MTTYYTFKPADPDEAAGALLDQLDAMTASWDHADHVATVRRLAELLASELVAAETTARLQAAKATAGGAA